MIQTRYRPKRHYMDTLQTAISREMRDNLVDYLVGVRVDLSLSRDSVFLAVNYLDRFLSKRVVTSTTLDSVCLAALLVSTKYEEVAPPDVLDLTRLLEGQFTPDDLLDMERELLTTLAFKLNVATIESFLPLAMAAAGIVNPDPVTTIHVEHVAWMAIADYDVAHMHLASVLAGASVIVAAEVFGAGGAVAHAAAGGSGHRAVVTHEQADQMWDGVCKWLGQDAARELAGAVSGLRRALRKPRMNIQRCTELALRAASKAVEA
ncbi:cyclin-like protein [Catenaria anguillulae PL171]|uniref:Cyclin-like protein n=1 Tax=Catenaria anguillulae PL171 TaxID=765915 RepID=A0A1Y2H858_9FUNG|nr:cyclin-like protein [Catenaria anguillulae PL171]